MNMKRLFYTYGNKSDTPYGDVISKPCGSYEYKLLLTLLFTAIILANLSRVFL